MISLSYSRLVMSHNPTFSCLFNRKEIAPSPLCPCGAVEDFSHYCFACPLLPLPSPTYAEIFKSKAPSKLKPIASLICGEVQIGSLPSYESKMKFLQGIIIQAVLHSPNFIYNPDVSSKICQAHCLLYLLFDSENMENLHN